jgi:hypothetical protein
MVAWFPDDISLKTSWIGSLMGCETVQFTSGNGKT